MGIVSLHIASLIKTNEVNFLKNLTLVIGVAVQH